MSLQVGRITCQDSKPSIYIDDGDNPMSYQSGLRENGVKSVERNWEWETIRGYTKNKSIKTKSSNNIFILVCYTSESPNQRFQVDYVNSKHVRHHTHSQRQKKITSYHRVIYLYGIKQVGKIRKKNKRKKF